MNMQQMKRSLKLGKATQTGFGTLLIMIVGMGIVSKISMNGLTQAIDSVTHTYEVKADLEALEKILVDAETGQRGFIFTNKESFLEPYNKSTQALKTRFSELKILIKDNPKQIEHLSQVEALAQFKMDELAQTISLKKKGQEEELRALVLSEKGKQYMDALRTKIAEMIDVEDALLTERKQDASRTEQFATWISVSTTLTAIILGGVMLLFITRKVVRPLNQVASMIVSSSTEIAATVEQQERTTQDQATAVNQTTTTMDELSASSRQSAEQAETAANGAKQVLTLVNGHTVQAGYSGSNGSGLREKVGQITDQILHLSEQTGQIGIISTLVSDLANQTNMLALNAAVEAVRAGEHGKGFGVVAAEIRKLADQSKKSAERINALVVDIKNATNSTVMVTDEGSKTVETIITAVNDIALTSQQISLTAKQQAIAIQQVGDAMNALNQSALQTASGISQTKVGTQKLNEAAFNLKAIV